jgi:glycerol kinase
VPSLKADGGAVVNAWLMQFQADVLGAPVIVPEVAETTALGAAYLAGIATGEWTAAQVREMWREAARYEPRMNEADREELLAAGTRPWPAPGLEPGVTRRPRGL